MIIVIAILLFLILCAVAPELVGNLIGLVLVIAMWAVIAAVVGGILIAIASAL